MIASRTEDSSNPASQDEQNGPTQTACSRMALSRNWQNVFQLVAKRVIDIIVSSLLLLLLAPILIVLAVAVKLSDRGPVLYHWRVVGQHGRPFASYKLRTMVVNADEKRAELERQNEMRGPVFKMTHDPRVTCLGAWMRRYSLDELPQLWSVLRGQMSLVGPRPPLATEYERFTDFQKQKLAVKPGITCLWQINGRNRINDLDEWVKLDLEYIRRWSPWLDVKILVNTIGVVFSGTGK